MKRRRKRFNLLGTTTACISTTLVLILLGAVVMTVLSARNFSRAVYENFTVEVLLDDSITAPQLAALRTHLQNQPYTRQVNYISKEQGTKEMMKELDAAPEDMLGGSPIPAEYEVFLHAEYANPDSLSRYVPALEKRPEVREVVYPLSLIDSVGHTVHLASAVLLCVAALFILVSFTLINNTVRMGIYARRFSIRTMKLVGARGSFIRRPFVFRALLMALISALLAGGGLFAGMMQLQKLNDGGDFNVLTPEVIVVTLCSILVVAVVLTVGCTIFSVNRHLRMSDDEMFIN